MKIEKSPLPEWAREILAAEQQRYGLPDIQVHWRLWRGPDNMHSSGTARPRTFQIAFTAGTDEPDQRVILLHEFAHVVVGPGHGHDATWRTVADELWARYGVTEAAALHEQIVRALPQLRQLLRKR